MITINLTLFSYFISNNVLSQNNRLKIHCDSIAENRVLNKRADYINIGNMSHSQLFFQLSETWGMKESINQEYM